MECVGVQNFAAMAVSKCPATKYSRRRRFLLGKTHVLNYLHRYGSMTLRIKCSSSSEGCLAVKENFANEEDYVKAGGSELFYVQMQQNKNMDQQSKLSDKVFFFFLFYYLPCFSTSVQHLCLFLNKFLNSNVMMFSFFGYENLMHLDILSISENSFW